MADYIIVGLGQTGLSVARYLKQRGIRFSLADTRFQPPGLKEFEHLYPDADLWLGPLDAAVLCESDCLIVSPGVPVSEPAIMDAVNAGVAVLGDIELFARDVSAPIVAITGSNAKSTVTTLVGYMAEKAGLRVAVGGNIGVPVLDLLQQPEPDLYVLELSSFQLETTHSLKAKAATILNLSPDHLDRYPDMLEYGLAKQRIYTGCQYAVVNRDDEATLPVHEFRCQLLSFGDSRPDSDDEFGIALQEGERWLAQGDKLLLPVSGITLQGQHGQMNALAALSLGYAVGIPCVAMLAALQDFCGLPHRCQFVCEADGVRYINDSKGTNVGATIAALNGLGPQGPVVLIAGGDGKGAAFDGLTAPIREFCRAVVLIGRDGEQMADALPDMMEHRFAASMHEAVAQAKALAKPGDQVLLSPACASFDMFSGYSERGDCFTTAVRELCCADK